MRRNGNGRLARLGAALRAALVREGLSWSDMRVQALSSAPVRLSPQPAPRDQTALEGVGA